MKNLFLIVLVILIGGASGYLGSQLNPKKMDQEPTVIMQPFNGRVRELIFVNGKDEEQCRLKTYEGGGDNSLLAMFDKRGRQVLDIRVSISKNQANSDRTSIIISPPQEFNPKKGLLGAEHSIELAAMSNAAIINATSSRNTFRLSSSSGYPELQLPPSVTLSLNSEGIRDDIIIPNLTNSVTISPERLSFEQELTSDPRAEDYKVNNYNMFTLNMDYTNGASMSFFSNPNKPRLILGAAPLVSKVTGSTVHKSAESITILSDDGSVRWSIP